MFHIKDSLRFFYLLFIVALVGCSGDNSITNSGTEENNNYNYTLTINSKNTVRPGGIIIFKLKMERIANDSLTGLRVFQWKSNNENIRIERQSPGIAAAFVPSNFNSDKFSIEANVSIIADNGATNNGIQTSKTIKVQGNPLQVEKIHGIFTSDTTLAKEKIYKLTKSIKLKNNAILTVTNGATLVLNGHSIVSNGGMLKLEGTKENMVNLIVGENTSPYLYANFKANFARIISSNNASGISIVKSCSIKNSVIFGHLVAHKCVISNSKISKLTGPIPGAPGGSLPISLKIYDTQIYQWVIKQTYEYNLISTGNTIFNLTFKLQTRSNSVGRAKFSDNNITYLSILNVYSDEINSNIIFKNNYISKFFIGGHVNFSMHNNNLGFFKKRFYYARKEPFYGFSWIDFDYNNINWPVVKVTTSGQYKVQKYDLTNNHWTSQILKEMNKKGPDKNISFLYDHHDDPKLDKVIYKNWSETKF